MPTNLPLVVVFSAVYGSPGEPSRGRGKVKQRIPDTLLLLVFYPLGRLVMVLQVLVLGATLIVL